MVMMLGMSTLEAKDGRDRRVVVVNRSGETVYRLYASNSSRERWEEDLLGSDVLGSGRQVRVNVDDGSGACIFDLKAETKDGRKAVSWRFNVCTQSTWTVE
jgi:hypothetical protein